MKKASREFGNRHLLTVEAMAGTDGEILPRQIELMLRQVAQLADEYQVRIDWKTFRLEVAPPPDDPFTTDRGLLEARLRVISQ